MVNLSIAYSLNVFVDVIRIPFVVFLIKKFIKR